MRRVVVGMQEFVQDFDKKHDNLLFTGSTGVGKDISHQLYCKGADG